MNISMVIAEDDELIRKALKMYMESFGDVLIVGEAADGREAVRISQELEPDIVLMDLLMPIADGIDATRKIKSLLPRTKVIALTMVDDARKMKEGLSAGIDAYLLKKTSPDNLKRAIHAVMAGKRYICPLVEGQIADMYLTGQIGRDPGPDDVSPREMEVLELVCSGLRTKEISDRLGISIKTVEKHRISLLKKLGANTSAELATIYTGLKKTRG